jgi:hypothetical protein
MTPRVVSSSGVDRIAHVLARGIGALARLL